jgi:hypothetical protein
VPRKLPKSFCQPAPTSRHAPASENDFPEAAVGFTAESGPDLSFEATVGTMPHNFSDASSSGKA